MVLMCNAAAAWYSRNRVCDSGVEEARQRIWGGKLGEADVSLFSAPTRSQLARRGVVRAVSVLGVRSPIEHSFSGSTDSTKGYSTLNRDPLTSRGDALTHLRAAAAAREIS